MKIHTISLLVTLVLLISCNVKDPESHALTELKSEADSLSYYLGVYTGITLRDAGYSNVDRLLFDSAFLKTFYATNVYDTAYAQADGIITSYVHKGRLTKTLQDGARFLAANKLRKEIHTTPSGLQYEILKQGSGSMAVLGDSVTVLFTGKTQQGDIFMKYDSLPAHMLLKDGTPGGIEALQLMPTGSKYIFYLPPHLGYGENPLQGSIIKPNAVLIYTIELVSVRKNKRL